MFYFLLELLGLYSLYHFQLYDWFNVILYIIIGIRVLVLLVLLVKLFKTDMEEVVPDYMALIKKGPSITMYCSLYTYAYCTLDAAIDKEAMMINASLLLLLSTVAIAIVDKAFKLGEKSQVK